MLFLAACLLVAPSFAKKKPPPHPVNLNTASSMELQQVPGIGPSTAEKILQMRKSYGSFKKVEDLLAIKGIGPKKLGKMRKYLTVGKPAQGKGPAPAGPQVAAKPNAPPVKGAPTRSAPTPKTSPAKASEDEEP